MTVRPFIVVPLLLATCGVSACGSSGIVFTPVLEIFVKHSDEADPACPGDDITIDGAPMVFAREKEASCVYSMQLSTSQSKVAVKIVKAEYEPIDTTVTIDQARVELRVTLVRVP